MSRIVSASVKKRVRHNYICFFSAECVNYKHYSNSFKKYTCSTSYCNEDAQCVKRGTGHCVLNAPNDLDAPKYTRKNCTGKQSCVYGPFNNKLFPNEYRCSDTFCRNDEDCTKRCTTCLAKKCELTQGLDTTNTCV